MMNLTDIQQHDTGQGPTAPGRWAAFDGEVVCTLVATQTPDGLSWVWDDIPDKPETLWTPGWPCAPLKENADVR